MFDLFGRKKKRILELENEVAQLKSASYCHWSWRSIENPYASPLGANRFQRHFQSACRGRTHFALTPFCPDCGSIVGVSEDLEKQLEKEKEKLNQNTEEQRNNG